MPSITYTSLGVVKFTAPLNVTSIQVECWGSGFEGGTSAAGQPAGPGGGAGEYAAEPAVTVIPGVTYYGYNAPSGTFATNPSNTTWNNGTVVAHPGTSVAGGTGSSNTVHHNGGAPGAAGSGSSGGGGGGGSSGAPSGAGHNGGAGSSGGARGAGGAALTQGGGGGGGGSNGHAGGRGATPGGGGGGAGAGSTAPPPSGGTGQIRITWASTPGPSGYPLPVTPFFPAGYSPAQADLDNWFHDPFAFLEQRVVARVRQATTPQSIPASGAATIIEFDTVDEDLLGGWVPAAWAWEPPSGFSGLYAVNVTLYTAALAAGNIIRPGVTAPGAPGVVAGCYPGAAVAGVQGSFWTYCIGGQDTIQATASLVNAGSNVNTDVTFGQQSSMEITWLSS